MAKRDELDSWLCVAKDLGLLPERDVRILCQKVIEVVIEEANVQPVSAPVLVVGDLFGKAYDLVKIFETCGQLPETRYIFLGNYVDRGYDSITTVQLLFCLKLKYPESITLLRGNHESREVS